MKGGGIVDFTLAPALFYTVLALHQVLLPNRAREAALCNVLVWACSIAVAGLMLYQVSDSAAPKSPAPKP